MQTDFQLSDILVDYLCTDSVGDTASFKAGYGTDLFIFDLDNSAYKCAICCNIVSDIVIESHCCGALVCRSCVDFFENKLEIDDVDLKCHACNKPRNSRISDTKNNFLKDSALPAVHVLCRFCNENGYQNAMSTDGLLVVVSCCFCRLCLVALVPVFVSDQFGLM